MNGRFFDIGLKSLNSLAEIKGEIDKAPNDFINLLQATRLLFFDFHIVSWMF